MVSLTVYVEFDTIYPFSSHHPCPSKTSDIFETTKVLPDSWPLLLFNEFDNDPYALHGIKKGVLCTLQVSTSIRFRVFDSLVYKQKIY